MSELQYVREYYKVPAEIGMGVIVDGKPGVIVGDGGSYIRVNFDHDKPGVRVNCHPTWKVEYTAKRPIRKLTRSQERYRRFLEYGDSFNSFIDFCRWDAEVKGGSHE